MRKKLTRVGSNVALVLDKPLLKQLGLAENAEVELSTNGDVLVMTPVRDVVRQRRFRESAGKITGKYAGVFRRLS